METPSNWVFQVESPFTPIMDDLALNYYALRMRPYMMPKSTIVGRSESLKLLLDHLTRLHSAEKTAEAISLRFDSQGL